MVNEKRIVDYGKSKEPDVDYKFLQDFDSVKPPERHYGIPEIPLLNLQSD